MLIIFPTIRNGFDINCVKLWVFFCKFCMLSIKFNYTASSSILKLLESCFHPSARSFDFLTSFFVSCLCLRVFNILSICPRDVFNPARNNVRFFFLRLLSLLSIDNPLSVLQCFWSSMFLPSLLSWPKPLRAFASSSVLSLDWKKATDHLSLVFENWKKSVFLFPYITEAFLQAAIMVFFWF